MKMDGMKTLTQRAALPWRVGSPSRVSHATSHGKRWLLKRSRKIRSPPSASLAQSAQVTQLPLQNCAITHVALCPLHAIMNILCCVAHQALLVTISQPSPGLQAGLLVNSTVFLLGIKVLLQGRVRLHAQLHFDAIFSTCLSFSRLPCVKPQPVGWGLAGLTAAGVLHSWALGTAVYSAFGAGGYVLVCLYFILGSAVRPHRTPLRT